MFISFYPKSIFLLLQAEGNEVEGKSRCALVGEEVGGRWVQGVLSVLPTVLLC